MAVANGDPVDINDLETIVEDTRPGPARLQPTNNRFSLPVFPISPTSPGPGTPTVTQDDSSLLALFARMQPLRASLDFLPMRLSVFEARASAAFPTACEELEMRRAGLDARYRKLEADSQSLRKELGEDRWVVVFRGAGRQAQKMYESVERSVAKLRESVDAGAHLTNQAVMTKKIESYEAKKTHYGPAIERVLSIIDRGLKDRLTLNGEILRLHAETQSKWDDLRARMHHLDVALDDLAADDGLSRGQQQQLRDSISSMLSNDRSTVASGNDTPQSSPPSSVIMSSLGLDPKPRLAMAASSSTAGRIGKHRAASFGSSHLPQPRRQSSIPGPVGGAIQPPRLSAASSRFSAFSASTASSRDGTATPTATSRFSQPPSTLSHRPKWNSYTTNAANNDTGHNFKPLSLTTPSPYAKMSLNPNPRSSISSTSSLTPTSASSKLPLRSPLSREASSASSSVSGRQANQDNDSTPSKKKGPVSGLSPANMHSAASSKLSLRQRITALGPYSQQVMSRGRPVSRMLVSGDATSAGTPTPRRASLQPQSSLAPKQNHLPAGQNQRNLPARPASSLATTNPRPPAAAAGAGRRRASLLPQPTGLLSGPGGSGRESPQVIGARIAFHKASTESADAANAAWANRPRWRH